MPTIMGEDGKPVKAQDGDYLTSTTFEVKVPVGDVETRAPSEYKELPYEP